MLLTRLQKINCVKLFNNLFMLEMKLHIHNVTMNWKRSLSMISMHTMTRTGMISTLNGYVVYVLQISTLATGKTKESRRTTRKSRKQLLIALNCMSYSMHSLTYKQRCHRGRQKASGHQREDEDNEKQTSTITGWRCLICGPETSSSTEQERSNKTNIQRVRHDALPKEPSSTQII